MIPMNRVFVACGILAAGVAYYLRKRQNEQEKRGRMSKYEGPARICVYGSASVKTPKAYVDVARKLGRAIAEKGLICVNGGGVTGVMGAVNEGCRDGGGMSLGVIHSMWIGEEDDKKMDEQIVTDGDWGLHGRKEGLMRNSDALIALPGGTGTFEELLEAMSMRALDLNGFRSRIPVCLVNTDGFYDGIILQMKRALKDNLLSEKMTNGGKDFDKIVQVFDDPDKALDWCVDFLEKAGEAATAQRQTSASASWLAKVAKSKL